jgi:hypothetical protein
VNLEYAVTGYRLEDRDSISDRARKFSLHNREQTRSEARPITYLMSVFVFWVVTPFSLPHTRLHGVMTLKTTIDIFAAVRTSKLRLLSNVYQGLLTPL